MLKDQIFEEAESGNRDFKFDSKVANVFDDMLRRSVPFYSEQQAMVRALGKRLFQKGTAVYDLGCSLGTTLINLCQDIGPETGGFIGYDNSLPMMEKAKELIREHCMEKAIDIRYGDLNNEISIQGASVVTMLWTLQFVRPLKRDSLVKTIYHGLVDNGVFIVAEKVLTNNTHMNRLFIELYYDYKKAQGYSDEEIIRKRESLENVLIPYRVAEDVELFKRNGFEICETFFQYYNFVGFLCIKQPS